MMVCVTEGGVIVPEGSVRDGGGVIVSLSLPFTHPSPPHLSLTYPLSHPISHPALFRQGLFDSGKMTLISFK